MGWIFAIGFAAIALAALWISTKGQRLVIELAAAMLLVGLAGYAWQGSPDTPGQPVGSK